MELKDTHTEKDKVIPMANSIMLQKNKKMENSHKKEHCENKIHMGKEEDEHSTSKVSVPSQAIIDKDFHALDNLILVNNSSRVNIPKDKKVSLKEERFLEKTNLAVTNLCKKDIKKDVCYPKCKNSPEFDNEINGLDNKLKSLTIEETMNNDIQSSEDIKNITKSKLRKFKLSTVLEKQCRNNGNPSKIDIRSDLEPFKQEDVDDKILDFEINESQYQEHDFHSVVKEKSYQVKEELKPNISAQHVSKPIFSINSSINEKEDGNQTKNESKKASEKSTKEGELDLEQFSQLNINDNVNLIARGKISDTRRYTAGCTNPYNRGISTTHDHNDSIMPLNIPLSYTNQIEETPDNGHADNFCLNIAVSYPIPETSDFEKSTDQNSSNFDNSICNHILEFDLEETKTSDFFQNNDGNKSDRCKSDHIISNVYDTPRCEDKIQRRAKVQEINKSLMDNIFEKQHQAKLSHHSNLANDELSRIPKKNFQPTFLPNNGSVQGLLSTPEALNSENNLNISNPPTVHCSINNNVVFQELRNTPYSVASNYFSYLNSSENLKNSAHQDNYDELNIKVSNKQMTNISNPQTCMNSSIYQTSPVPGNLIAFAQVSQNTSLGFADNYNYQNTHDHANTIMPNRQMVNVSLDSKMNNEIAPSASLYANPEFLKNSDYQDSYKNENFTLLNMQVVDSPNVQGDMCNNLNQTFSESNPYKNSSKCNIMYSENGLQSHDVNLSALNANISRPANHTTVPVINDPILQEAELCYNNPVEAYLPCYSPAKPKSPKMHDSENSIKPNQIQATREQKIPKSYVKIRPKPQNHASKIHSRDLDEIEKELSRKFNNKQLLDASIFVEEEKLKNLRNYSKIQIEGLKKKTKLHELIANNDICKAIRLIGILLLNKIKVDIEDENGKTPFLYAVERNQDPLFIEYLLRCGANPNIEDPRRNGIHALHLAHGEVLKKIVDSDATDILVSDYDGNTVLHKAILRHKQLKISDVQDSISDIGYLLTHKDCEKLMRKRTKNGDTAFDMTIQNNTEDITAIFQRRFPGKNFYNTLNIISIIKCDSENTGKEEIDR